MKKWGPFVTTGLAVEAAVLLGVAHTVETPVMPVHLLSASIFVDGTKPVIGAEDGVPFLRMADSFQGRYAAEGSNLTFVDYPRSLGMATGFTDPTYNESEADAAAKIVRGIRQARADDPTGTIYVVGYSQGAGTVAGALAELERDPDFHTGDVEFVLASNPRRNSGGILTRLPAGVYVPLVGVTFGEGTTPERTKVLQVSKMYDGISDAPDFVLNIAADANAVLGFVYLHSGYYQEIDPNDPSAIVTTSRDGLVTDKLIPTPVGQLPLTMPLLELGVPPDLVTALDPFLRAVIETGYERPDAGVAGTFPSEPVPFRLVPPPTRWVSDAQTVAAGAVRSAQLLSDVAESTPTIVRQRPVVSAPRRDDALPAVELDFGDVAEPSDDIERPARLRGPRLWAADREDTGRAFSGWRPGDLMRSAWEQQPPTGSRAADAEPDDDAGKTDAGKTDAAKTDPSTADDQS